MSVRNPYTCFEVCMMNFFCCIAEVKLFLKLYFSTDL